ncbi:MAG: twin-arginine translocase subunit TatC [Thaumarchaeota archaeon]|nr:twin-arginine translocase subunit TatC [Nitrososphaerota archaeon]MDE1866813.1 twin-arginine translocase subunit TatC [Nitrososphaerota archaeon]
MDKSMTIMEHLDELRKRVFRMVIAVGIITFFILGFHLTPYTYNGIHLYYPTFSPFDNIAAQATVSMKHHLLPPTVQLIQTAPGQAFFAQFYVAVLLGIAIGMPVIVKEFIGFLTPALGKKEIHIIKSITAPAIGLFAAGCIFSYFVVTPYTLAFLYKYGESAGLLTFLNIVDFITFVLQFALAFGVSFQLPLIMYAVTASGMVGEKFWRNNIKWAVIAMVILGAAITPDGSGVTMWFVAGPLIVLYLVGMFLSERHANQIATLKS